MLGAEGVSNAMVARLKVAMPAKLDEIRRRTGADPRVLPDLVEVYPTEVHLASMNVFPFASVVQTDTTGRLGNQTYDLDAAGEQYSFAYRMRVYVWAAGDSHPETDIQRKRLALAVREVFLGGYRLYEDENAHAAVNPSTIRESYSDVGPRDGAAQFVAAAFVELEVVTQEFLETVYGASADPVDVDLGVNTGDTSPVPPPTP